MSRPDPRPTLIDLFAGCGGGSVGFAQAGFRVAAGVEIDQDAAESFRLNLGVTPIVRDIRRVTGDELLASAGLRHGDCTLLFGCPPCQSFTVLRHGDELTSSDRRRNRLPLEYLRLLKDVYPRHIAFENVPGMIAGRRESRFGDFVASLERLGYRCVWDVLDAADYGVPQHRKRLLLVGSRVAVPFLPAPTHAARSGGGKKAHLTVRSAIGALRRLRPGEVDPADLQHRARNHSEVALQRLRAIPEGGARLDLPKALQLECHKEHEGHYDIYGRMWWDRPAPTLTSGCTNVTRGRFAHPRQNRAITLREAMLLQTFPPKALLAGSWEHQARQVGNAVPPLLAERLGECVLEMERASRRSRGRAKALPASA